MALEVLVFGVLGFPAALAAAILLWGGVATLIDAWQRRHPCLELVDRVTRFRPRSVADEAEEWLSRQT